MTFIEDYNDRWHQYVRVATALMAVGMMLPTSEAECLLPDPGTHQVELMTTYYESEEFLKSGN